MKIDDLHLLVLADPGLRLKIGDQVNLKPNPDKVQFFDPRTEHSLLWA